MINKNVNHQQTIEMKKNKTQMKKELHHITWEANVLVVYLVQLAESVITCTIQFVWKVYYMIGKRFLNNLVETKQQTLTSPFSTNTKKKSTLFWKPIKMIKTKSQKDQPTVYQRNLN